MIETLLLAFVIDLGFCFLWTIAKKDNKIHEVQKKQKTVPDKNYKRITKNYHKLIDEQGFENIWKQICSILKKVDEPTFTRDYFDFEKISWLYENGLAYTNKQQKKLLGKYYTPKDVAQTMAKMLFETDNCEEIADVGCGTGNLIIETLEFSSNIKTIHLYDIDKIAMDICEARIICRYGNKWKIVKHKGDFLSPRIKLPNGTKVISNPPYAKYKPEPSIKDKQPALYQSKDIYIGFIEKILESASDAVIINPQSFLVGSKFSSFREELRKWTGDIYSFDNVPTSAFKGKKEGVFNTNTSNSVRASIVHIKDKSGTGFKLTHLIRFKDEEREQVINYNYLKEQLGNHLQNMEAPLKCFRELEDYVYKITQESLLTIKDLISTQPTDYKLRVNKSARYFIVGTKRELNRTGYFDIYAKDEDSFYKLYLFLNSSYCYLFYRMFDGGINFSKSIMLKTPIPDIELNKIQIAYIKSVMNKESDYLVYKMNAGANQESVKFPVKIRNNLNKMLNMPEDIKLIHKNNETLPDTE